MIEFDKLILDNGLKIIVHKDSSTPIIAMNILYNVGARDEDPEKTGFAHLFEHLMFGGSRNIPQYDIAINRAGGEYNAFTNNDITNYYLTLPQQSIETAFWLESDRMDDLAFSSDSLKTQRNVVVEEYKQSYLNQPYGNVWLLLRPLAYLVHPYQWPTIGKNISHIENAVMKDVKDFYRKYYCPDNAIMTIAGNIETSEVEKLARKWFEPIKKTKDYKRELSKEPVQISHRKLEITSKVPFDAIYIVFHMCKRSDPEFQTVDLISDILSQGTSSRFYQQLIKENQLFSEINAYITGELDEGLFVISGKLMKGISMQDGESAIWQQLENLKNTLVDDKELQKVKNKIETLLAFSSMRALNNAMNLSFYELLGDASMLNLEVSRYLDITREDIREQSNKILNENNCSTLYYLAE
ncbi:MAG: insulinase family protein [Bacteroidales bacterium]|nr:insulinase family protein [Bacteroidales bacterium]